MTAGGPRMWGTQSVRTENARNRHSQRETREREAREREAREATSERREGMSELNKCTITRGWKCFWLAIPPRSGNTIAGRDNHFGGEWGGR